jgi:hypothetical protein
VSLLMRDLAWARPSLTGAERGQADQILARPTDTYSDGTRGDELTCPTANQCVFFYLDPAKLSTATTDHFEIHYYSADTFIGPDVATPAYVAQVEQVLEEVYTEETARLGFHTPLDDTGVPSTTNPDSKIDIYLGDLGQLGIYGYCSPDTGAQRSSAYCALDNDFATRQFQAAPLNSLRVTAAHEFFHAIQYSYDAHEARWFMEGSAVWMEDVVYNAINDYRQYIPASPIRRPTTPFTTNSGISVYGAFTIFKFLTGYLHDPTAVRQAWQAAAARVGNNSLAAVSGVLSAHHRTPRLAYAVFGAWNTLLRGGYPEASTYRPAGVWHLKTLTKRHRTAGTWRATVRPLANAPVVFLPSTKLPKRSRLRITVNAPYVSVGGAATLQVRYRNGKVSLQQFGLNARGDRTRTVTFNPRTVSSVVVVLTNGGASASRKFAISAKAS